MADLRATLRQPFAEQVAAFRLRLADLVPTARWDDLAGAQHDRAFMVAGATKADLLADLAAAVEKAISEGTTLETFRRDFRAIVERRGWHGWTGEGTAKGEAWRMRVIYRTNLATSYAAGRHAQLVEGGYAFWVYFHGGSLEPRPQHLGWDGVALPPDHPVWATHYPPNGWGCSCYVSGARSPEGVRRVGGDPDKRLPEGWQAPTPKTGVPEGIDRGWDHAPGASVAETVTQMARKSVQWPTTVAKAYMEALPEDRRDAFARAFRRQPSLAEEVRRYAERAMGERGGAPIDARVTVQPYRTMGLLTSDDVRRIEEMAGHAVTGYDYAIDPYAVRHIFAHHGVAEVEDRRGQRAVEAGDFEALPQILDAPDTVTHVGLSDSGHPLFHFLRTIGGSRHTVAVEIRRRRRMLAVVSMWVNSRRPPS